MMGIYKIRTEFGHQLRWLMGILAVIFIIGGAFMFSGMPDVGGGGGGKGDQDVVATVNDLEITRGEFNAAWDTTAEAATKAGVRSTLQLARARASLMQQLIGSRMTLAMAEKLGVAISSRAVEAKRDEVLVERLRAHRRAVMGQIDADEERSDPRDDKAYKDELSKGGMSLGDVIRQQEAYIPEAEIQRTLALDGIRKALQSRAGVITPQDVTTSYNVYGVRQIIIPRASLPADQLTTRVNKIASEAKKGSDFAALAKQYSQDTSKGAVQSVSYGMVASEVWDRITKMKTGEVANPIATDQAIYIVKLENVAQKLPAKFDKKAQDARRSQILNQRIMEAYMKAQADMSRTKIDVKDLEMRGYWELAKLGQERAANPAAMKKQLAVVAGLLKKAYGDENSPYAGAMLALVFKEQGNKADAKKVLGQLLEGKDSRGTGADLHIMYGDLLLDGGSKSDAANQYAKASESAGPLDGESHKQLVEKFKKVGRPDLAAKEQEAYDKYVTNKRLVEAQQAKSGAVPVQQPQAPTGP